MEPTEKWTAAGCEPGSLVSPAMTEHSSRPAKAKAIVAQRLIEEKSARSGTSELAVMGVAEPRWTKAQTPKPIRATPGR